MKRVNLTPDTARANFLQRGEFENTIYVDTEYLLSYNHIISRSFTGLIELDYALASGHQVFILEEDEINCDCPKADCKHSGMSH